jgi:hypothetical protein
LLLTKCKEYSYEGGDAAEYTFVSSAGTCSGSVVEGQYTVGVKLSVDTKVTLQLNVTKVGQYSIITATVNGMQFFGSGKFTNTGLQTVVLKGGGTPTALGNFTFAVPGTSACTFIVSVTPVQVIYADYSLQGAPSNCQNPAFNGNYTAGKQLSNTNTVVLNVHVTSPGAYSITTDTLDGIYFNASGNFTAAGNQTVILQGFSTPSIPGNFYFSSSTGNASCSFKLSVANPEPVATYVIESIGGTQPVCVYTLAGTYNTNVALNNTNTVTIRVYVTVVGNFTISTNIVDGIKFSYTGTFANTGVQFVTLQGSGTPAAAGTFLIAPEIVGPHPLGGEGCGFNLVVN